MDFRLELNIKPFLKRISIQHRLLLMGSCFTENIGQKLIESKFKVMSNPAGIIFNPFSILKSLKAMAEAKRYTANDLFLHNDVWTSWDFHGSFADTNRENCLQKINQSIADAHQFLADADWMIITLGSAFRYDLLADWPGIKSGEVVANCHKVNASHFNHRLAGIAETTKSLFDLIELMQEVNPSCEIIFTISPVRHFREGLVENNRSKGVLHIAVMETVNSFRHAHYFPSYELVIDDLRDYRFFAEDLVHPNYAATQYVWQKFTEACINDDDKKLMDQIAEIRLAYKHRSIHPDTNLHQDFLKKYALKTKLLQEQHPYLNLEKELDYFLRSSN